MLYVNNVKATGYLHPQVNVNIISNLMLHTIKQALPIFVWFSVMILHYNTTLTPSSKAIYSGTKYYDTHIEFHSLFLDVSSTDV